jgi:NAD(P)-dependent dehydrogenase (short-subunit alcohol dehydrogenase family)
MRVAARIGREAMPWTHDDIPDQSGRTIIVTGANSGIGLEAAKALAGAGAHVVLACRDPRKADAALGALRAGAPRARLDVLPLDLASLASVRDFAKAFADRHLRLDVLVNNAGVMAIPRRTTADGFEMQLGTNHLGHFALTGLLLPLLLATQGSRVVTVSSTAHRGGRMRFDDLHGEQRYTRWGAYGQSKLANLLFSYELDRRAQAAGHALVAAACHPGYSATNLQFVGPRMDGSRWLESLMAAANRLFSQDAAMGALPTLYAATAPEVRGGDYIGPDRFFESWGHPKKVGSSPRSHDREAARRLWELSEQLTGVGYEGLS